MRDIEGCALCDQLWHEYSETTLERVRLNSALRLAALTGDAARIADLTTKCETAEMHRANVREVIKTHKAEAHPQGHIAIA